MHRSRLRRAIVGIALGLLAPSALLLTIASPASAVITQVLANPSFEQPGANNAVPTSWTPIGFDNETTPFGAQVVTMNASGSFPPPAGVVAGSFALEVFWQVGNNLGVIGYGAQQTSSSFGTVTNVQSPVLEYNTVQTFFPSNAKVNWAGGIAEVEFTSASQTYKLRYYHKDSASYSGAPVDSATVKYSVETPYSGNNAAQTNVTQDLNVDIQAKFGITNYSIAAIRVGNLEDRNATGSPFPNMTSYWDNVRLEADVANASPTSSCGAPVVTNQGTAAARAVSATDLDGTMTSGSVAVVPAAAGITLGSVVPAGAPGGTLTASVNVANTVGVGAYTATVTFANNDGTPQTTSCQLTITVNTAGGLTPISAVQGSGATSPFAGQTVTVEGVVTGIDDEVGASFGSGNTIDTFQNNAGIFIQEEPADQDSSSLTSEGIFVGNVLNRASYPLGTLVRVTAPVRDGQSAPGFGMTMIELSNQGQIQIVGSAPVPAPIVIDETQADAQSVSNDASPTRSYYETLEGMRVRLVTATANSGGLNKFGELFMMPGTVQDTLLRTDPVEPSLIGTAEDAGSGNPANPYRPASPSTTQVLADRFDTITDTIGPLAYSFGNYKIMVQPGLLPTVTDTGVAYPYDRLAAAAPGELRVASYNVENYFPVGGALDGGLVTLAEFNSKTARLTGAIGTLLHAPDVIGVSEVYSLSTLQALATSLTNAGFGPYTAYLVEGHDARGIDVGFLVKSTVVGSNLVQYDPAGSCSDTAGKLFDRPPLAIDIAGTLGGNPTSFTVIVNHFRSKGSDASGACQNLQAAFVRDTAAALETGGRNVVVLGDLNQYEDEPALATLQSGPATLTNLWDHEAPGERFSFQFNGVLQTLDHILVSNGLDASVAGLRYAHIGNDYFDRYGNDGHKASDHDAVVLTLSATPPPSVPESPLVALLSASGVVMLIVALTLDHTRRPRRWIARTVWDRN